MSWTSIKHELPPDEYIVLGTNGDVVELVEVRKYTSGCEFMVVAAGHDIRGMNVTHWMPLPRPPITQK